MKQRREATVCFFTYENKVLLAKIKYPDGIKRWNGIGGFVDNTEVPEKALLRELQEELDIELDNSSIEEKIILEDYPGIRLHVFTGGLGKLKPKIVDPTIEELKWFNFNEIPYNEMWEGNETWIKKLLTLA